MQRFRGGLVFKAHRLCVSLNSRLGSNKEEENGGVGAEQVKTILFQAGWAGIVDVMIKGGVADCRADQYQPEGLVTCC